MTTVIDLVSDPVDIITVNPAEVGIIDVTEGVIELMEVQGVTGTSELQRLVPYLSLDGGRPAEVFTNIDSLDGGGV